MPDVLRFVDPANIATVRLDLNGGGTGFSLGRGLHTGVADLNREVLSASPYAGGVPTDEQQPQVQMVIPLVVPKQASITALVTLYQLLATELDRENNAILYQPNGLANPFVWDTYRSPIPPLMRGQGTVPLSTLLFDPEDLLIAVWRHPVSRGAAGAYI